MRLKKKPPTATRMQDMPTLLGEAALVGFRPLEVVTAGDLAPSGIRVAATAPVMLLRVAAGSPGATLRAVGLAGRLTGSALRHHKVAGLTVVAAGVAFLFTPGPGTEVRDKLLDAIGMGRDGLGGAIAGSGGDVGAVEVVDTGFATGPVDAVPEAADVGAPAPDTDHHGGGAADGDG